MMLQKKSSKSLPKFTNKKTKRKRTVPLFSKSKPKTEISQTRQSKKPDRRTRNRIRKLTLLLIPISLIISIICVFLIFFLIQNLNNTKLISPITTRFLNISDEEDYKAKLEKALQENKIDYTRVYSQKDGSCIIKLTDGSLVIISSQKDINREISSLQFILKRLTMEGKEFTKLDLRFEKPVITFK